MIPKAALSSPKLLQSHSVLKNIMEKTEDKVKLTCHTAKKKKKKSPMFWPYASLRFLPNSLLLSSVLHFMFNC